MKLYLNDEEVDWDLVKSNTQTLAELDSFLRLNEVGSSLRMEAITSLHSTFKPLIFGIANSPREFKVYRRPVQEILEDELLTVLKVSIKTKMILSIEWIQNRLIEHLDGQDQSDLPLESVETSDPSTFSEESWRLIHLANGLTEVEGIQHFLDRISASRKLSAAEEVSIALEIEAGQFAQELLANGNQPTVRERRELESLVANGKRSFDLLFESSFSQLLGFAVYYRGNGLTILELIQEGCLGLIRAIQKFDSEKGYRFSTYATWWIRQSMTRSIADSNSLIRVPVHRFEEIRKVHRIFKDLEIESASQNLEPWERAYILKELEIDDLKLNELLKSIWEIESVEPYLDSDKEFTQDSRFQEGYDLSANDPFDFYQVEEFETHMQLVLNSITNRESYIIQLRYGFYGYPRTLQEIGEVFDLTRERIRQIESKTMSKLRHPSRSEALKDYLDIDIHPVGFQRNLSKSSTFLLPKEKQD